MQVKTVEKPMCFKCDCGEQYILGVWKKVPERDLLVIRFLNNINQFRHCPWCGSKMSSKNMEVEG